MSWRECRTTSGSWRSGSRSSVRTCCCSCGLGGCTSPAPTSGGPMPSGVRSKRRCRRWRVTSRGGKPRRSLWPGSRSSGSATPRRRRPGPAITSPTGSCCTRPSAKRRGFSFPTTRSGPGSIGRWASSTSSPRHGRPSGATGIASSRARRPVARPRCARPWSSSCRRSTTPGTPSTRSCPACTTRPSG